MKIQLELVHKKAKVKNVLVKADTVIGRSTECGLRIASNEVSRQHCKICLAEDGVTVRDLGSSNGTFVNGYQLEPDTDYEIAPDSELSVGGIKFIVRFSEPTEKAMQADGLGSTVDFQPRNEDETVDLLREEADDEDTSYTKAGKAERDSESGEAESGDPNDTTQTPNLPESDHVAAEAEFALSTHGDSAILQDEPESQEPTEPPAERSAEPADDAESKSGGVVVDLKPEERKEAEPSEETKPPLAKPVEGESKPESGESADAEIENGASPDDDEPEENDSASFLDQISEEESNGEDSALGDFFKHFD